MRTKCKECRERIPGGAGLRSYYAQKLRLCAYCYRHKHPERRESQLPPLRMGSERLLSWDERRYLERAGFNPEVWSPEFRAEMEDYWAARERGEI